MNALIPKITNAGLTALLNATNNGLKGKLSHIAFGDGLGSNYAPAQTQTALKREKVRIPIGGGERVGPFEVNVQALLDTGPSFTIREVGFFLDDGTMLAIWADPTSSLAEKTAGVPLAVSYNLALAGIPPGSITLNISGPTINLTIAGPLALISAEVARAHRLGIVAEHARIKPLIEKKWS